MSSPEFHTHAIKITIGRKTLREIFIYYSHDYMPSSLTFFFCQYALFLWLISGKWPLFSSCDGYMVIIYIYICIQMHMQVKSCTCSSCSNVKLKVLNIQFGIFPQVSHLTCLVPQLAAQFAYMKGMPLNTDNASDPRTDWPTSLQSNEHMASRQMQVLQKS